MDSMVPALVVLLGMVVLVCCNDPLVTLSHGGQLQGVRVPMQDRIVDHFVGVRYAKPPVEELRFEKPVPAESWSGVLKAQTYGSACLQPYIDGSGVHGSEDCLFLNVYVPDGVKPGDNKPVMVWIHGGGFVYESATPYVGSILALHGDVVIVSMNYRLGVLGFLPNGPGTGNYGLWDQREAIVWTKENIASFGGNPNLITIFGESAGSGSVSAQTMGQHNDGLFSRAIAQSGVLYTPWAWYPPYEAVADIVQQTKANIGCGEDADIYECYRGLSGQELLEKTLSPLNEAIYRPVPDDDFFPSNIDSESYDLAQRYDMMAGFNGQEGGLWIAFQILPMIAARNESVDEGCSLELVREFLQHHCSLTYTTQAPELCADFIIQMYGLDKAVDGRDRAIKLSLFMGDVTFVADGVDMLEKHSSGDGEKRTYGYYLTKKSLMETRGLWELPMWLTVSADHAEDLSYVFGMSEITDDLIEAVEGMGIRNEPTFNYAQAVRDHPTVNERRHLSLKIMTMWTNFAKTGDPNLPVKWTDETASAWQTFSDEEPKLLQLDDTIGMVDTPNKDKLSRLRNVLKPAMRRKYQKSRKSANAGEDAEVGSDVRDEL